MRQIKFRAWDFENKQMRTELRASEIGMLVEGGYKGLMQFTGLLDKNGKEVFEGDIVTHNKFTLASGKYEASEPKVVFWDNEKYGFETNKKGSFSAGMFYNQYENIGNIYENPELLTN